MPMPVGTLSQRCAGMMIAVLLALVAPLAAQPTAPASTMPARKLIEFGWDEPDTAYMRKHIEAMEKTPFDGCVFHLNYTKPDGTSAPYVWECWGNRAFTDDDFANALADLKATPFKRFKHNFLRFNTAPGDVDWFDDFSAILGNARLAAKIARAGKAAGILFDIEQYNAQLFDYRQQRDKATKSWEQYAAQAKKRGGEVMRAFHEGYPDLTILMTWATSLPYIESGGDPAKLPECSYGLLAPFLDGMLEAATGKTKIVDGYESSYSYKEPAQFADARTLMKEKVLSLVGPDDQHRAHVSAGFGVWMDYDWRKFGWNTGDFAKNYFTPETFEKAMSSAWTTTDEYVWVYTEEPRWWGPDGNAVKLPDEYDQALRRATGR